MHCRYMQYTCIKLFYYTLFPKHILTSYNGGYLLLKDIVSVVILHDSAHCDFLSYIVCIIYIYIYIYIRESNVVKYFYIESLACFGRRVNAIRQKSTSETGAGRLSVLAV
jgi:hypothetical protein